MKKNKRRNSLKAVCACIMTAISFLGFVYNVHAHDDVNTSCTENQEVETQRVVRSCVIVEEIQELRSWLNEQEQEKETEIEKEKIQDVDKKFEIVKTTSVEAVKSKTKPKEIAPEKNSKKWKYDVSDEEFWLLCKIVLAEETPWNHKTKQKERISIAASILHRAYDEPTSKYFPDTVKEVLNVKNQYNPVHNGVIMWRPDGKLIPVEKSDISQDIIDAVESALEGEDPTKAIIKGGALYYYSYSYFESENADSNERKIREAISDNEKIQFGDTVFHRVFP